MTIEDRARMVAALPRPRGVRLSKRGKSWLLTLGGVWLVAEACCLLSHSAIAPYAAAAVFLAPFLLHRGWVKQRQLVRDGAVTVATVTSTSNSPTVMTRNDDVRTVQYRFTIDSGEPMSGNSVDPTLQLRDGAAMLLYYDTADPSQQVAQCASYYVVDVPDTESGWLDKVG